MIDSINVNLYIFSLANEIGEFGGKSVMFSHLCHKLARKSRSVSALFMYLFINF